MTGKKLLSMMCGCVCVMTILLGSYCLVWNFSREEAFDEEASIGVLSEFVRGESGPLSIGDRGEAVQELQATLAELGYYEGESDGVYGLMTGEAVRRYQSDHGILEDGKAGIATLYSLGLCGGEVAEEDKTALLAAAIALHASEEPFGARIAVGAVILERARLLGSLACGIAYYHPDGASGGGEVDAGSYAAAKAAMAGMTPVENALFFSREKPRSTFTKLGSIYFYR